MASPSVSTTYSSLRPTSAIPCTYLYKFGPSGTARALPKLRMQMASARLLTFQNWNPGPDGAPSPTELAMAGFVCKHCFYRAPLVWIRYLLQQID